MSGRQEGGASAALRLGGLCYWTASLLPALVGTTLPFWLDPPGFTFRWLEVIEFLIATLLFHAGFSFMLAWYGGRPTTRWPRSWLFEMAGACLIVGYLLGLHLSSSLPLHAGVPRIIFVIYGLCVFFVGALYVAPPFRFHRRVGGEIILCGALGMMPVLGAYLVQAGDLPRPVCLASLPLVIATALWVWVDELITREDDEKEGRLTTVMLFSPRFSRQFITLALAAVLYATIVLAVLASALAPWALAALLSVGLAWKLVALSWKGHADRTSMDAARGKAFALHLITGIILTAAPLAALVS